MPVSEKVRTPCEFCDGTFASKWSRDRHIRDSCKYAPWRLPEDENEPTPDPESGPETSSGAKPRPVDLAALKRQITILESKLAQEKDYRIALDAKVDAIATDLDRILNWSAQAPRPLPTQRKKISQPMREAVWRDAFGSAPSLDQICGVCCQTHISFTNFECGHIKSVAGGGDNTVDNLRPICGLCNKSMGARHMDEYMAELWQGRDMPKLEAPISKPDHPMPDFQTGAGSRQAKDHPMSECKQDSDDEQAPPVTLYNRLARMTGLGE